MNLTGIIDPLLLFHDSEGVFIICSANKMHLNAILEVINQVATIYCKFALKCLIEVGPRRA